MRTTSSTSDFHKATVSYNFGPPLVCTLKNKSAIDSDCAQDYHETAKHIPHHHPHFYPTQE